MLKLYDHLDGIMESERQRKLHSTICHRLASELMKELGYTDEQQLQGALLRSFDVCCNMHISISENYRKVYCFSNGELRVDYQLSDLGCYLLIVNGDASNPHVARAQLYGILSRLNK